MDLIVDQFYSIIYFLCNHLGAADSIAKKNSFDFTQFSTQWLSILVFVPLMAVVSLKNINFLIKLSEYGSASIFVFALYVVAQFLSSASSG